MVSLTRKGRKAKTVMVFCGEENDKGTESSLGCEELRMRSVKL